MRLERLLSGFGVLGVLLVSSLSDCSAVDASASTKVSSRTAGEIASEDEQQEDSCVENESKNAKYTGVSFWFGLNFLSRELRTYVSDDYVSGSPFIVGGDDLRGARFLKKKVNNLGLSLGLNYDFVWTNGLLVGVGAFADCMLGGREKSESYIRQSKVNKTNIVNRDRYETVVKLGRFTPGVSFRLGTHFDIVDACVYATVGLYFPSDKTYLIYKGNGTRRTLEDSEYKWKKTAFFYGVGLKKLLPSKFFGHNLGMIVEVKRLCGKSDIKAFDYTIKRQKPVMETQTVTTSSRSGGATWMVTAAGVINF